MFKLWHVKIEIKLCDTIARQINILIIKLHLTARIIMISRECPLNHVAGFLRFRGCNDFCLMFTPLNDQNLCIKVVCMFIHCFWKFHSAKQPVGWQFPANLNRLYLEETSFSWKQRRALWHFNDVWICATYVHIHALCILRICSQSTGFPFQIAHSGALNNYSEGIMVLGVGKAVKYIPVCFSINLCFEFYWYLT